MENNRHFKVPEQKNAAPHYLRIFFALFMALFFIFVGLLLLFDWWNVATMNLPQWFRWVAGPIFLIYGVFRGWRVYDTLGNPKTVPGHVNNEDE